MTNDLLDKIVSLCKRRGFIFPGSEIYGGLANSWDYGPLGVELKNNIKQLWWKKFVQSRDDMVGLDTALIMNPKVWEASGHLKNFTDPLVECKKCHRRFPAITGGLVDFKKIKEDEFEKFNKEIKKGRKYTPGERRCIDFDCGGELMEPKQFNLMFLTYMGPTKDTSSVAYFRPETAQGMFVDFKNILDTTRVSLPFGVAQIGKAFRNEITPGNFIFRTREFEQMEIEYFIREKDWEQSFEYWKKEMSDWIKELGVDAKKVHEVEIPEGERAHYSKRTVDFEYEFPFGQKELYGLAYRTDFDLKNHEKFSGQNLKYKDLETGEEFWPHVIEPTWGVDRSALVVLLESYAEEEKRIVLKLPFKLAPYKAAVFPLLANKPELVEMARKIYDDLRKDFMVVFDGRGNIGKRYYSQDEIGTPFCVTVDFDSLEKGDVTIRNRDTMKQERVKIENIKEFLEKEFTK
ncbi:MAG: glycine--tRNA ligase [Patescibacteria group bacterium]